MLAKVSVIMAVYNHEQFLAESIRSILSQTYQDFEIIAVNDGSEDNSLDILEKFQKLDHRIKVLDMGGNFGAAAARNKGLEIANGEFITPFDADDICFPARLETEVEYLSSNQDIFMVSGGAERIFKDGNHEGFFIPSILTPENIALAMETTNCIYHGAGMWRNAGYRYREKFKWTHDYEMFLRMLSDGKKISNLTDLFIKYRLTPNYIESDKRKLQFALFYLAQEFYKQRKAIGTDNYDTFDFERLKKETLAK